MLGTKRSRRMLQMCLIEWYKDRSLQAARYLERDTNAIMAKCSWPGASLPFYFPRHEEQTKCTFALGHGISVAPRSFLSRATSELGRFLQISEGFRAESSPPDWKCLARKRLALKAVCICGAGICLADLAGRGHLANFLLPLALESFHESSLHDIDPSRCSDGLHPRMIQQSQTDDAARLTGTNVPAGGGAMRR